MYSELSTIVSKSNNDEIKNINISTGADLKKANDSIQATKVAAQVDSTHKQHVRERDASKPKG